MNKNKYLFIKTNMEEDYIVEEIKKGNIKSCPHCNALGELASGCNYIKCPLCNGEWCFVCNLKKYHDINGKEACNDKSHNSH